VEADEPTPTDEGDVVPFLKLEQPSTKASQRADVTSKVIIALLVFNSSHLRVWVAGILSLNDFRVQVVRPRSAGICKAKLSGG